MQCSSIEKLQVGGQSIWILELDFEACDQRAEGHIVILTYC